MPSRHEEKYIITYQQYAMLKSRAMALLTPDSHAGEKGYLVTSLYFDDHRDNALWEKLDGLPEHSKFRIRSYDYSDRVIKLERKDKRGILTEKFSAGLNREQTAMLARADDRLEGLTGSAYDLAAQMQAKELRPVVAVRYKRDAFFFEGSDLRLTFDRELEAIGPEVEALFSREVTGLPVLDRNSVVMEIKYGEYVPAFVRMLTAVEGKQLSVSKYALCREKYMI